MRPIDWQVTRARRQSQNRHFTTRRSVIETPVFMPVGTQARVKGVRFEWLENEHDARIILGNTYHLFLRPGPEVIRQLGGLHKFSTWNRSLLTDSGGFQVFSLTDLRKLTEDGVQFRSHIDGSPRFLSPEVSMEVQAALGSEIVMAFDECLPGDVGYRTNTTKPRINVAVGKKVKGAGSINCSRTKATVDESKTWKSCRASQALFGIVQGRGPFGSETESLDRTVEIGFDGYAIGGLSVGEEKSVMYERAGNVAPKCRTMLRDI